MGQLSHKVDIPFPLFDADGSVYVTDESGGTLQKFSLTWP